MRKVVALVLMVLVLMMSVLPVYSDRGLENTEDLESVVQRCRSVIHYETHDSSGNVPYRILYSKDGYTGYLDLYAIRYIENGTKIIAKYIGEVCLVDQY